MVLGPELDRRDLCILDEGVPSHMRLHFATLRRLFMLFFGLILQLSGAFVSVLVLIEGW